MSSKRKKDQEPFSIDTNNKKKLKLLKHLFMLTREYGKIFFQTIMKFIQPFCQDNSTSKASNDLWESNPNKQIQKESIALEE